VLSRTDDLALLMGRVFVAALFLPHGFHKLMTFWSFAASLGAKGVPYANAVAVLAVVAEILGPLTLIIGLWPRWTALVLAVLTLLTISTTYRSGAVFLPRRLPARSPLSCRPSTTSSSTKEPRTLSV
jgi:putative oxidoreductase